MYLIWTVIYMPLAVIYLYTARIHILKAILFYIKGFLLVGAQYNSWHLWYLLASIYALFLIWLLLKKHFSLKVIVSIGVLCFTISIIITGLISCETDLPTFLVVLRGLLDKTIRSGRIFTGIFYISIGMYLKEVRVSKQISCFMLIAGYFANLFIVSEWMSSIFIAISSIGLFIIVKSWSLPDSKFFPFARLVSTVVYFCHMWVWTIYYRVVYGEKRMGLDCFVVSSIVSILLAFIYIYIQKNLMSRKSDKRIRETTFDE